MSLCPFAGLSYHQGEPEVEVIEPDDRCLAIDASRVAAADLATVDAVVRLQLEARRRGLRVCLRDRDADGTLRALLALTGLADVVPTCPDDLLVGGCRREPEHREQPRIEEVRDVGDPTA